MLKQTAVVFGLMALATGAHAESDVGAGLANLPHGVYFGASLGQSKAEVNLEPGGKLFDSDELGWKLSGGYRFSEYFSAEAFYLDAGDHSVGNSDTGAGLDVSYWGIAAVGTYPLKNNFGVFARVGYVDWQSEFHYVSDDVTVLAADQSGNDVTYGAGFETSLDGAVVRLGYEFVNLGEDPVDADLSLVSLEVNWFF